MGVGRAYKSSQLNLVDTEGFEPFLSPCKGDAFPVMLPAHLKLGGRYGTWHPIARRYHYGRPHVNSLSRVLDLVEPEGLEPS